MFRMVKHVIEKDFLIIEENTIFEIIIGKNDCFGVLFPQITQDIVQFL